ncbi:MAG TPA: NAD(P)-dependent oxidoreductase [Chloroflexota bacterium]|nr:NAD(P)-dependent oxidoreductase [Chloroflexota bacterium]
MKVTVLGLGSMGTALATRLLDTGHQLTVWNRTAGRVGDLVAAGAQEARVLPEATADAEVVFTLLSNDAAVKAVALDGGVAGSLGPDTVLVDMSTVSPTTSREIAAATPGGRFVDAPILGRPQAFGAGRATLLLGGNRDVVERLGTLWDDLSAARYYTGPNGTATTLKLLSNLILVGGTHLLVEAVITAQALGLPNETLRTVFGGSPAVAPGVQARLDDVLEGDHVGWWTLLLADKDLTLVLDLAREASLRLPIAEASEQLLRRGIDAGYGEKDLGVIADVLRQTRNNSR